MATLKTTGHEILFGGSSRTLKFDIAAMIDLESARNVTISGIVFYPFDGTSKFLRLAPGQCANIVSSTALSSRTLA